MHGQCIGYGGYNRLIPCVACVLQHSFACVWGQALSFNPGKRSCSRCGGGAFRGAFHTLVAACERMAGLFLCQDSPLNSEQSAFPHPVSQDAAPTFPEALPHQMAPQGQAEATPATGRSPVAKRLMGAVSALLLLGGGGAFAVANLQGEQELIFPRLAQYEVPSLLDGQNIGSLLGQSDYLLYRSERLRANDTAEGLLQRLGVSDPAAAAFLRRNALAHKNLWGRHSRFVTAEVNTNHELGLTRR